MSRRALIAVLFVCVIVSCRTTGPTGSGGAAPRRTRLASGTVPPYAPSQPYGFVPGTFSADGSGAATFELPIAVPPGTAGVQPSLALAYTSHRENGYVGMGWQLSGLSAIGRCGANYELDGYKAGVEFDARDRFCIDGNRLIAISGPYGADGTVYHTAHETQTSVISNGSCGNGPCSFTAYNKNGQKLDFGGTTDSRILAQGRTDGTVRAWALDRQTDLNGNYTAVVYSNDPARGEYVPTRIDYTGNDRTGLQPQRRVEFTYEARPDPIRRYLAGSMVQVTSRLHSIETSVSGQTVQTYTLAYDTSSFTLRSRPTSVTVCDAAGVCLPPVSFEWQTEAAEFAPANAALPGPLYVIVNNRSYPMGVLQDFDGDGIADYSVATEFVSSTKTSDLAVWRGRPDGTFVQAGFSLPGPIFRSTSSSVLMCGVLQDIDGDGILDYSPATYNASTGQADLSVYLGTRNGFTKASFSLPDAVYWQVNAQTMQSGILSDMNGDGIPDYSRATRLISTNQLLLSIWKGTGSGFQSTGQSLPGPLFAVASTTSARVGVLQDINGDGIPDYSPATVNASTGASDLGVWTGRTPDFTFTRSFDLPGQLLWMVNGQSLDSGLLVDLNGDGIPDYSRATELISNGQRILDVYLGTGSGFVDGGFDAPGPVFFLSSTTAGIGGVLSQMNGDGTSRYSRATQFSNGTTELGVWLGSGEGFREASFSMPEPLYQFVNGQIIPKGIYEDLNGDGMTDFANATCTMTQPGVFTNCNLGVRLAKGPFSDLLAGITNSFGGRTLIEYKPLSDPAVYTRGGAAVYPVRDAQSAMYALSRYSDDDARGAHYAFSYHYTGAAFDVRGHDWLGFSTIVMTEEAGGRQSETKFSTTYPYNGLVTETAMRGADGKLLESSINTYTDIAPAGHQSLGVHQALQTSLTVTVYQDGAPAYSYGRDYEYDQYGNVTYEKARGDEATNVAPLFTCARYLSETDPRINRLGFTLQKKATRTEAACREFLAVADGNDVHWNPAADLRWTTKSYDANLNILQEADWSDTHSSFVTTDFTVDPYGNVTTFTTPAGDAHTYTYDATYHTFIDTVTTPPLTRSGGETYTMTMSRISEPHFGILVQTVDSNGNVMQQDIDGFGRPAGVWGPDPDGNLVQLASTLWKHDARGTYLDSRSRPQWTSAAGTSDWYWKRTYYDGLARDYREERNGLRNGAAATIITERFFDALGRVHRETAPYYDGDPAPVVTTEYDPLNRPTLTTNPSNVKQRLAYLQGGLRITMTEAYDTPNASTSIQLTDVEGRTRQRIAANGQSMTFTYDPLGQLLTMDSAPQSRPSTLTYDSLGNVTSVERPDTGRTIIEYDSADRFRKVTDASGNSIEVDTYDALHRIRKRSAKYAGQSSVWSLTYDETGYRNGLSHLTTAVIEAPLLGTATYHYGWNAYDNILAGETTIGGTTYHYAETTDPSGRLSEEIDPDGSVVSLRYGSDGNLARVELTEAGAGTAATWATLTNYTAEGELQDLSIENGVQVARRYYPPDVAFGKLKTIDAKSTRQGNRSLLSLTYAWNQNDEITGITNNDHPEQSQTFGYRDQPVNQQMGFLTSASGGYGAKNFRYEELGNLTQQDDTTYSYTPGTDQMAGNSGGVTWQFLPNGFLKSRTEAGNRRDYAFNADGELVGITQTPVAGGAATELLQAAYDHTGRKVMETSASGTIHQITGTYEVQQLPNGAIQHTRYVGGPFGPVGAITGNGTGATAAHRNRVRAMLHEGVQGALFALLAVAGAPHTVAFGAFALLALPLFIVPRSTRWSRWRPFFARIAPLLIVALGAWPAYADLTPGAQGPGVPTEGRVYFVQDLIGSSVSVTGSDGNETARVAYEPFGRIDQPSSSGVDNFRPKFSGKAFDPSSGLYDFAARHFDPLIGRYISPDPLSQFASPYLYGGNDPIAMIDPTGELAFLAAIAVAAVIGAYFGGVAVNDSFNPAEWNWQSGKTWAGIFGGAALGAVGAAAGGLVAYAGVAVGSMGGTAAQVAGVAIGIAGEALIGAGENAAFTAMAGGTSREIMKSAVSGAFFGAVFGAGSFAAGKAFSRKPSRSADEGFGEVGPDTARVADSGEGSSMPCSCGCSSFVAGTPVSVTGRGGRAIERVAEGDRLDGREPVNGTTSTGRVSELLRHETQDLVRITLATGEQLEVTPEHPFYLDRSGWVAAGSLAPGDALATATSTPVLVASVETRHEPVPVTVYNFEVDATGSYYAGEARVLVHNGKPKYCRGGYKKGIYTEYWSKKGLKKAYPVKADYKNIKAAIIDKMDQANNLIATKGVTPMTSVANPVQPSSLSYVRAIARARKLKSPSGVRAFLSKVFGDDWGPLDVDEIIARVQGGLGIREGWDWNQWAFPAKINSIQGAVAGGIARAHPGQPITHYRAKFK